MEKALFKQHIKHFSQAQSTPMGQPYLASIFGPLADTEVGKKLREDTADVESLHTDIHTKEFLKELQQKTTNPPFIDTHIEATTVRTNYKNWKEQTNMQPEEQYL
eukprot:11104305-Ditylum_brightwellii.AAC.1